MRLLKIILTIKPALSRHTTILTALLFAPVASLAHHASAPHFHVDQDIVIENAVISELKMVNPHSYLYFNVAGEENEMVTWRCGLRPASALLRQGWTNETFVKGQIVTIKGKPAKREDNVCLIETIVLADGKEIGPTSTLNGGSAGRDLMQDVESDPRDRSAPVANGQPDISGDWVSQSFVRGGLGGQNGKPYNGFDPTEVNLAAAEPYDIRFDDPALKCHPINIIQGWNHDANVNQIVQFDDRVVLTYGFVDLVRTIYLNAKHPEVLEPSIAGHSIGTWQGDVLEVHTTGFLPGVLSHRVGIFHSDQMRITERFFYDDASHELVRDYVIEDPLYLNTPYIAQDRQGVPTTAHQPYNCAELSGDNNIRPETPDF